jgi:hypothetical protein
MQQLQAAMLSFKIPTPLHKYHVTVRENELLMEKAKIAR